MSDRECTLRINGEEIPITSVHISVERELPDRVESGEIKKQRDVSHMREYIKLDCECPYDFVCKRGGE
jgi:GDP-D-mannose dehydratase